MVFKITSNIKDTKQFIKGIHRAVNAFKTEIVDVLSKETVKIARERVPVFEGTLQKNITRLVNTRIAEANVFIRDPMVDMIGSFNETGVNPHIVNRRDDDKVDRWMASKGKPQMTMLVGGPNTRLGRQNVFWRPSFEQMLIRAKTLYEPTLQAMVQKHIPNKR